MTKQLKFTSIDDYIASASLDVQRILQEIRHVVKPRFLQQLKPLAISCLLLNWTECLSTLLHSKSTSVSIHLLQATRIYRRHCFPIVAKKAT